MCEGGVYGTYVEILADCQTGRRGSALIHEVHALLYCGDSIRRPMAAHYPDR